MAVVIAFIAIGGGVAAIFGLWSWGFWVALLCAPLGSSALALTAGLVLSARRLPDLPLNERSCVRMGCWLDEVLPAL